jgi:hypothetical protein
MHAHKEGASRREAGREGGRHGGREQGAGFPGRRGKRVGGEQEMEEGENTRAALH